MLDLLDDAAALSWTARAKALETFMMPAAVLDGHAVLARDGSLVSLARLDGARSLMGAEELAAFTQRAHERWNAMFSGRGHALHVVFEREPGAAAAAQAMARQRQSAARLGLDLADLLDERDRRLGALAADEQLLMAVWTRPAALTPDRARADRRRARRRLRDWLPRPSEAQCPLAAYDSLGPRHDAAVAAVASALDETGIAAEVLDAGAALAVCRRLLNGRETTAPDWRPAVADRPPRESCAEPPPLAPQLLLDDPVRAGPAVLIGARRYRALDMVLGPRRARPFSELMARVAEAGLPARLSILIEGGGLNTASVAVARVASAFLAFSSDDSRAARNAYQDLAEVRASGRAVVRLRISMLTWVERDGDDALLGARLGRLQQILEGWGGDGRDAARRRSAGELRRHGADVRLRLDRGAGPGAARRGARHAAGLAARRRWPGSASTTPSARSTAGCCRSPSRPRTTSGST